MKLVVFGATNSNQSINRQLAAHAASLVDDAEIELLDLNDYEMPIYSPEREQQLGQPQQAQAFFQKITEADALIISFAEHNGSYTAAYKNLFDWTSRIDMKVYQNKPILLLSTSPGPGGANSVLQAATGSMPYFAGIAVDSLSVPNFYDNFDVEAGRLSNPELSAQLAEAVAKLEQALQTTVAA
ncbi:NADPH-dependent FMN reductase [Paraferrimonas sedimenticola]|uniref:FMN reductase n=1 Tax=Paraferrimonas sedimenticola TaxID=375674 RepID=A0AA37VYX9_9GAMM|nr:NAD(P)H-dependent oxidoreductase [Paraferrimonas sedimenticola]GLP97241.1 FMN reductase [Paraferrimonas sedimenticola]